jgi:hypothetical protein
MSSSFARAKQRYQECAATSRREAALKLCPVLGVDFYVSEWSGRAREALANQWIAEEQQLSIWNWNEIHRRHQDPDRLDMVIWGPESRLCGLGLCLTSSQAVEVRFVEGDPRQDCPLKGKRTLIFLECAAGYAQLRGKSGLRIEPKNQALETLYSKRYGFSLETPRGARAYYKKVV